jgi:hypothetical protein
MGHSVKVFATIALLLTSRAVLAQELKPLKEAIADGAEETYALVRCAGLYLSVLEWAGEDRLGKETADKSKVTVANLIELATSMREPALQGEAEKSVFRDVRAISDEYLDRYKKNYALVGEAFGQDPMWNSDNDVCIQLLGN